MRLEDLLFAVNDDTMIEVLDNNTGEVLVEYTLNGDLSYTDYDDAEVMDVSIYIDAIYGNILVICVDTEN